MRILKCRGFLRHIYWFHHYKDGSRLLQRSIEDLASREAHLGLNASLRLRAACRSLRMSAVGNGDVVESLDEEANW